MKCPICLAEMVAVGPSRLDQCQATHLPAQRWRCPNTDRCEETTRDLPTGERWRPDPYLSEAAA